MWRPRAPPRRPPTRPRYAVSSFRRWPRRHRPALGSLAILGFAPHSGDSYHNGGAKRIPSSPGEPHKETRIPPLPRRATLRHGRRAHSRISVMLIATWNVNSIKQRLDPLVAWLTARQPHIVCLQETKCVDEAFPREALEALGYNVAIHGQKTFNGVAILSKFPFDEVTPRLPGDDADDHARFIETVVSTRSGVLRIASLYLPNGNPPNTDKYGFKLR